MGHARAFSRALCARPLGLLTWEEGVRRMTSAAAQRLSFLDHGLVRPGHIAELVVFDPYTLRDTATYENPRSYPIGVSHVVCAIELRSPRQFTFDGFAAFNHNTYRALLDEYDMLVDGINPIARTNVVPELNPPAEPSLYAFSYTAPARRASAQRDFVVAGAGELYEDKLDPQRIVRLTETSDDAMHEKAV
ncbi:MAG: hypothetical protein LC737_10815, partial [Chloroflexi bacterium]|nr:hypothetical protein [Chloroflexota bacterium]